MTPATELSRDRQNAQLTDALATASVAIATLDAAGVSVLAVMTNGRRPLLMIDRMPADTLSVIKRRHPNGFGGMTVVRAAEWHGCQLEAMHDEPPAETRIKQCGRPLEVVRG